MVKQSQYAFLQTIRVGKSILKVSNGDYPFGEMLKREHLRERFPIIIVPVSAFVQHVGSDARTDREIRHDIFCTAGEHQVIADMRWKI